jgi:DNA-binding CsgD family transcriptional regulator
MKCAYESILHEQWFQPPRSIRADVYLIPEHDEVPEPEITWEERRLSLDKKLLFLRAFRRNAHKVLSKMEQRVLRLTTKFVTISQIAQKMSISKATVKVHYTRIRVKSEILIEKLGGMNIEALNNYIKARRVTSAETRKKLSMAKMGPKNPRHK